MVAREWFAKQQKEWSIQYADKIIHRLERDIFPWIGNRPVGSIAAPELLKYLERIEQRGAIETAHRALQTCGAVFRYAVRTGRADGDPTGALKGALTPWRAMPFAAATTADAVCVVQSVDDPPAVRAEPGINPPGGAQRHLRNPVLIRIVRSAKARTPFGSRIQRCG